MAPTPNGSFKSVTPRLRTADLQRAIRFYSERLGFKACVLWPDDKPTFCILERDGVHVAFHEAPNNSAPGKEWAAELYFEVSGVDSLHAALRQTVTIEWGPEVYPYGCRESAFRDPDGYLIILSEPTDDPSTCGDECD